ncbi:MAG: HD-GYP domain-containing protein [Defluviitaleaceae bacterium]|nr:HD-GYP domain-containing protein [Defluviitaleaceae bacterium]
MKYYKVLASIENIKAGMVTASPVFIRGEDGEQIEFIKAASALSGAAIDLMKQHGVKNVTIISDIAGQLPSSKFRMPNQLSKPKEILNEELTNDALEGIQGLFAAASSGEKSGTTAYTAVKQLDDVVDQLVETVSGESKGLIHIAQLKSYDDYTYHHSLSVAMLSIAIGQALGLDRGGLRELGRTAIMHDIGKILVPLSILHKPSKLTRDEFEIMKTHSAKGARYLKKMGIGDENMWDSVRAHHEKVDGTGYPDGLKGDEIPYFAQIITVADVYDAVTSFRPYRGPMSPSAAFEMVVGDVGRAFEHDIVAAFAKTVEFYPIGTAVKLSNERVGVVTNNLNALRPTLQMIDSGRTLDLTGIDNLDLVIERIEDSTTSPELMEKIWGEIL